MAGLYSDAPGRLFMTDLDGSAGFGIGISGTLDATAMTNLIKNGGGNNLNIGTGASTFYVGYIFPELRDIAGFCLIHSSGGWGSWDRVETSANTSNGTDGTWTDRGAMSASGSFRSITALAVTGVKAIRFRWSSSSTENNGRYLAHLHVYGEIPTAQSPDRLRLWHPTLDQELTGPAFDFGDFGRGGTIDRTFRVKNNSSSLTANSIVVARDAPTDTSPTVLSQTTIGLAGSFATTQNIGALAPGALSAVLTLRIASLSNTTLGLWRQRLSATAGSWT